MTSWGVRARSPPASPCVTQCRTPRPLALGQTTAQTQININWYQNSLRHYTLITKVGRHSCPKIYNLSNSLSLSSDFTTLSHIFGPFPSLSIWVTKDLHSVYLYLFYDKYKNTIHHTNITKSSYKDFWMFKCMDIWNLAHIDVSWIHRKYFIRVFEEISRRCEWYREH